MNKILHVNIGAHPFTIDVDAFEKLDAYLLTLQNHFSKSDGCKEIMHDIESRMAELFVEKSQGRTIISIDIVNQCIQIMGTPESFGTEWQQAEYAEKKQGNQHSNNDWGIKTGKKLFRDPENQKIAGVCAGIATYLGIQDVTWVRLAFLVGFAVFGAGLALYIGLWIAMPEAKTASDRLAMTGDPINIDNIARKVEEELDHIKDKFEDWQEKRKNKKRWR